MNRRELLKLIGLGAIVPSVITERLLWQPKAQIVVPGRDAITLSPYITDAENYLMQFTVDYSYMDDNGKIHVFKKTIQQDVPTKDGELSINWFNMSLTEGMSMKGRMI